MTKKKTAPEMVGWYDPSQLLKTGVDVALSTALAGRADFRLIEALARPQPVFTEWHDREEIWFDYIADVGDGWRSTYSMAWLVAQPRLSVGETALPRGEFLVLGGDAVYPVANRKAYRERFVAPYEAAAPKGSKAGVMFSVPGNHDWYDGLVSFTRLFCQEEDVAGWETRQTRSYFAIALPHDVWLFAIDIQLESDIDTDQLEYFKHIMKGLGAKDRVIICTAEPDWVLASKYDDPQMRENVASFEADIEDTGAKIIARIAGDQHHYRRHVGDDGSQYVTAGGGGAFLHPTHPEQPTIELEGPSKRKLDLACSYPTASASRWMTFGNLLFFRHNPWFGIVTAVLYCFLASSLPEPPLKDHSWDVVLNAVGQLFASPAALTLVSFVCLGFVLFTDTKVREYRWAGGLLHASAHLTAALLLTWGSLAFVNDVLHRSIKEAQWKALSFVGVAVGGYFAGGILMGLYLLISLNVFGRHANEAFSSLKIEDYKNFLRLHLTRDALTIYPVKLERVPEEWSEGAVPRPSKNPEPALIENPIRIPLSQQPRR